MSKDVPKTDGPAGEATDRTRRRLMQAGLIGAPFLLTLMSRPALAQGDGGGSLGNYGMYGGDGTVTGSDPTSVGVPDGEPHQQELN